MKIKSCLFVLLLHLIFFANAQDCKDLLSKINSSIAKAQLNIDGMLVTSEQPKYIETFILYPVLNRHYFKSKNRDTLFIRKFPDFSRVVWCFKNTCFANNKYTSLSRDKTIDNIESNNIKNSYDRENICMLCNKYKLDSLQLQKIIEYPDTNDYALLHKALQLVNLKANNCVSTQFFDKYKIILLDSICGKYIFNQTIIRNDLYIEALLMISILDERINLSDEYYEYMINTQTNDGGWKFDENQETSNGHTTIIAYWTLLDIRKKILEFVK